MSGFGASNEITGQFPKTSGRLMAASRSNAGIAARLSDRPSAVGGIGITVRFVSIRGMSIDHTRATA